MCMARLACMERSCGQRAPGQTGPGGAPDLALPAVSSVPASFRPCGMLTKGSAGCWQAQCNTLLHAYYRRRQLQKEQLLAADTGHD